MPYNVGAEVVKRTTQMSWDLREFEKVPVPGSAPGESAPVADSPARLCVSKSAPYTPRSVGLTVRTVVTYLFLYLVCLVYM